MTPKRLVLFAALLVTGCAILDAAGGRGSTAALSGSVHAAGALLFAVAYMALYFAAVLVAPPLVLCAGALAGLEALRAGTGEGEKLR